MGNPMMARLVNGQTGDLKNALGLAGAMRNPTGALSNAVMEKLKKIDEVAYVRFASVYRQFKDINTFMNELNKLLTK